MKQRVLIVDDSPFIRRMLSDWLKDEPDFEVVGTGADGEEGARMAVELKPDIVTLDVEMPKCNGIEALGRIMKEAPTKVVMVSSVTTEGAAYTLQALELGATDFVTKPNGGSSIRFIGAREELLSKLRGLNGARIQAPAQPAKVVTSSPSSTDKTVLIASSTGGPKALTRFFSALPKGFPAPILLVQHMPAGFTASLASRLGQVCSLEVREAIQGDSVQSGIALVAPGGQHMSVNSKGKVELTDEPPLHGVKPAADLLFASGAKVYGNKCVGVVLTGMGKDGASGAHEIHRQGGVVYGECESSCVVYGMPKAAKDAGAVDAEYSIDEMAGAVTATLAARCKRAS